jgi:hypothetical protein
LDIDKNVREVRNPTRDASFRFSGTRFGVGICWRLLRKVLKATVAGSQIVSNYFESAQMQGQRASIEKYLSFFGIYIFVKENVLH